VFSIISVFLFCSIGNEKSNPDDFPPPAEARKMQMPNRI
jgi:hypothetical protein